MKISSTTTTLQAASDRPLRSTITRSRVLATSLPVAALLLVIGEATFPKGLDNPATNLSTAAKEVAIAGAHPNQCYAASLLVIFGLAFLGISFSAMATLVRQRGAVLATVVAVLAWFTTLCGVISNTAINYALAAAAATHPAPGVAARIWLHEDSSSIANLLLVLYFPGLLITVALAALALWRSQAVPRWIAPIFAVAFYVAIFSSPGPIPGILQSLPFIVIMSYLAIQIWRKASSDISGGLTDEQVRAT
jgi:hypothetical protein